MVSFSAGVPMITTVVSGKSHNLDASRNLERGVRLSFYYIESFPYTFFFNKTFIAYALASLERRLYAKFPYNYFKKIPNIVTQYLVLALHYTQSCKKRKRASVYQYEYDKLIVCESIYFRTAL